MAAAEARSVRHQAALAVGPKRTHASHQLHVVEPLCSRSSRTSPGTKQQGAAPGAGTRPPWQSGPPTLLRLRPVAIRRQLARGPEQAEALFALGSEQGFAFWAACGTVLKGWMLAESGQAGAGLAQMREGLAAFWATGAAHWSPYFFALTAGAHRKPERRWRR
jgi:hypothetical protein